MSIPADVPAIHDIYDSQGWSGLYVAQRDGVYQVREHGTGAIRSTRMSLPELREWLRNNRRTCPDLT